MTHYTDRWLLPDGVEEILPDDAQKIEQSRRQLLDTYQLWGYQLVIPPLLEFTESLLTGVGNDLDLLTVKVTDQLSGRAMGLRPDITPQTARIDAHSLVYDGPNRLCYADHVVHAKSVLPQAVRTPIYAGVELFGEASLDADIEVVSLLLQSLTDTLDLVVTIDLGHVGIYRSLVEIAGFTATQESELFELLQAKAITDIQAWIARHVADQEMATWLLALPNLSGDYTILAQAQKQFAHAPAKVSAAIDQLVSVADIISRRYPQTNIYFDLSELRGYHYHTGIVFAAYVPGLGNAVANGGRYDSIGEAFGRPRPATGFSIDLTSIMPLLAKEETTYGIYVPKTGDSRQWQTIQNLRRAGETVVCGFSKQSFSTSIPLHDKPFTCDRQLVMEDGEYKVIPLDTDIEH